MIRIEGINIDLCTVLNEYVLPRTPWVPSLATNQVAVITRPLKGVLASTSVGVGGLCSTIGPPGVVIAIAVTCRTGSPTTSEKGYAVCGVGRHGEDSGCSCDCSNDRGCKFDGDHVAVIGFRKVCCVDSKETVND